MADWINPTNEDELLEVMSAITRPAFMDALRRLDPEAFHAVRRETVRRADTIKQILRELFENGCIGVHLVICIETMRNAVLSRTHPDMSEILPYLIRFVNTFGFMSIPNAAEGSQTIRVSHSANERNPSIEMPNSEPEFSGDYATSDLFDLTPWGRVRPESTVRRYQDVASMSPSFLSFMLGYFLQANANGIWVVYVMEDFDRLSTTINPWNHPAAAVDFSAVVAALPKVSLDKSMMGDGSKVECIICYEKVEEGSTVTMLPCKHWYHGECIGIWLKQSRKWYVVFHLIHTFARAFPCF